ncbi:MAG: Rid family hydrolase [Anaerolineales bacterium]|jgi:2-iminobutanoate/2-iminopropanoate deaminase
MADIVPISTPNAPKGRGPFPQAVAYGGLLFISGQGPLDPETSVPRTGSFEEEARLTLNNVKAIVEAAGGKLSDALNLKIYLIDVSRVPEFNAIYAEYFPDARPARTLIEVRLRGIQVEIDGVFAIPES